MSQPAKTSLRDKMPETAKQVDRWREQFGKAHVNDCIRRATAGEAGLFYAMEKGNTLGTPFPSTHPISADQRLAVLVGSPFAAFIAEPAGYVAPKEEAAHGAS